MISPPRGIAATRAHDPLSSSVDRTRRDATRSHARGERRPLPAQLLAELARDLNVGLDPSTITAGSGHRLWWRCCWGHVWQAPVDRRSAGSGCPFCAGSRATPETSLAAVAPAIAAEWHPTRNIGFAPEQTMPGSSRPVWWQCASGHEWPAAPQARVTRGSGCPYCSGRLVTPDRSLPVLHPELAAEWHPTRNEGIDPATLSPGSSRLVWWRCARGHEWQARVKARTKVRTGCPRCADRSTRGVPLWVAAPDVFAEWDEPLNGGPPGDIAAGSHKQRWWRCATDPSHIWRAEVRNRVRPRSGCPYCAHKKATYATSLAGVAPGLASEWHPERNRLLSPSDLLAQSNRLVWWRCPRGHEWQARPANRLHGSGCPHCAIWSLRTVPD